MSSSRDSFSSLPQFSLAFSFSWQGLMTLFYLLLILWPEDSVYLDQEALREEYVLNDSGLIWIGTARKHCGMPWNFGQVRGFVSVRISNDNGDGYEHVT